MFYERPGPGFKTRFIVVTATVVATVLFMLVYRYWTTPVVPVFPDIENADGTIDYTLVGTETDYNEANYPPRRLVAYNKMVVRLPKHLGVTRPLAEGGSVEGEGVKFSYAKNPNAALRVGMSWSFLAAGHTNLVEKAARPSSDLDELSLSIKERPERKWRDRIQSFWNWCELVEPKPEGFVQYVPKSKQDQFCYRVSHQENKKEYVLLKENKPLAFVGCAEAIQISKKYCIVHIYHRDYLFVGDFAGQHIDEFLQVFPSLIAIIDKSIVSQSRTVLN
jgi:hypothetical protein